MKYKTTQTSGNTLSNEGTVGGYRSVTGHPILEVGGNISCHFSLGSDNVDTTNFYTKREINLMMQDKVSMRVHTIRDLPKVGDPHTIYFVLSEKAIYIWIESVATYICVCKESDQKYAPLSHVTDTSNPHKVTKEQVGLGNVPNYGASNSVSNDSDTTLATSSAVKQAYDVAVSVEGKADEALTKATDAEVKANEAIVIATGIETKADEAIEKATTAETKAEEALTKATGVEAKADEAIKKATTAETKVAEVETKADNAVTKANEAMVVATGIEAKADSALAKATTAETKADNAMAKATGVEAKANEAITKAEDAITKADSALTKATTAETKAGEALTVGTNALNKATELEYKFTEYVKTYKSLEEIDPTFTTDTLVKDVILAMADNTMAIYSISANDEDIYPMASGTVIITKQNNDNNYTQCSHPTKGTWYTSYHSTDNPDCDWKKLLTGEDLQSRGVIENQGRIVSTSDANTIVASGIYQIWDDDAHEAPNFPIPNPIGTLVVAQGVSFVVQTFTHHEGKSWMRSRGSAIDQWGVWRSITNEATDSEWGNIKDKPTEFPPSPHTHSEYIRIYKSLTEINSSFTTDTPVKDVVLAMEDNTMALYSTLSDDAGVYPTTLGTVVIFKQTLYRNYIRCSHPADGVWYTSYNPTTNPNCDWKKVTTATPRVPITSSMMKNGWGFKPYFENSYIVTNNVVAINCLLTQGTLTTGTIIMGGLPRTSKQVMLTANLGGATGSLIYEVNGDIRIQADMPTAGWVGLDTTIVLSPEEIPTASQDDLEWDGTWKFDGTKEFTTEE